MKTIKMFQTAAVVLVLAVLTVIVGCSDQMTSPTSSGEANSQYGDLLALNSFNTQITLKPHRSYTFNAANTGLKKITSIFVSAVSTEPDLDQMFLNCQDIVIQGDKKSEKSLDCSSNGLDTKSITITNRTSNFKTLDVLLAGVKVNRAVNEAE